MKPKRFTWALLLVVPAVGRADEPAREPAPSASTQFQALLDEYETSRRPQALAPQFFNLAAAHPQAPTAVDALGWIAVHLRYRPEAQRALEVLQRDYLHHPRLVTVLEDIAGTASPAADQLLRAAIESSTHKEVRANACMQRAALLEQQAALAATMKENPRLKRRYQQYYGRSFTDYLASVEPDTLLQQQETVYETVLESYADVAQGDVTMGDIAERTLSRLRHLSVGKPAPEIEGEDIDGKRFQLSDYRGKVVVLSFWGHW